MHFQTNGSTEYGLQMISETLLEAFRLRLSDPLLTKWNPRWAHRNVSVEHGGDGQFVINVKGLAHIHTRGTSKTVHVVATARVAKRRGCMFPISVSGNYADDHCRDIEYPLEKEKFPKDW